MHSRHSISSITCTLLFALAACGDPSDSDLLDDIEVEAEADVDADAEPELVGADEAPLSLPRALVRAGVEALTLQGEFVDPAPPTPVPGPVPERPSEGDYLLFSAPQGPTWVPYTIVGEDVMIGDDVRLGTVDDILGDGDELVPRALGESSLSERWPGGIINYDIDLDVGIPNATVIYDALDRLEAALPLRFVLNPNATDKVYFELWDNNYGLSEGIGMSGGSQKIKLPQSVNVRTVAHEMLHVLGLFHEQQRPDRDNYVDYHPECVNPGSEGNFTKLSSEDALGPYDLASLMHYRGTSQCAKDEDDKCICDTLTYAGTDDPVVSPTSGCDQGADPICFFSDLDVGSIWTMYGDFFDDVATASDYLGWATAAGDFDGDGLDDIASSAVLAEGWKGKVMTFKGSYGIANGMWEAIDPGIVPWRVFRRGDFDTPAVGDLFGMSLIAGDFDGDDFDDLAIGAPGVDGHGAVYLYRGSRSGLVADVVLTPTTDNGNLPFAGADYGSALAKADLNGDGIDDLIVGAPGDRPDVGLNACGGVYSYRLTGAPDLLARWNPSGSQCQTGAQAGASVAGTTRSGGWGEQIAVGGPGADDDRGRAWTLYYTGASTLSTNAYLTQSSPQSCTPGGILFNNREVGDRFGAAIAAGKRGSRDTIAIGSPGEDSSTGQVDIFRFSSSCWLRETPLTQSPLGANEPGDLFGAALAIGNLTGDSYGDLLVGAPGEAYGSVKSGWMYSFRGTYSSFVPLAGFGQSTGGWTNGNGERFGNSFVLAEIDGNIPDLIVGAPGNHVGGANYAGSLFIWQGDGNSTPDPWRALSANSKSPYAN